MRFSILVCSLAQRQQFLERLRRCLRPQIFRKENDVEVLVEIDHGRIAIGTKRNILVSRATGEYCAFVDDDDLVAENYVDNVLQAIENKPDCVGIEGEMTTDGHHPRKFIHSLRYKSWFEKDNVYYRNPNHLNPIRRELMLKVPFPELNHGEDSAFSLSMLPLLQTEEYVKGTMYFYDFRTTRFRRPTPRIRTSQNSRRRARPRNEPNKF
jgi:hypothetical protein